MRKFLWILTIVGSLLGVLTAIDPRHPVASQITAAQPKPCDCSHVEVLSAEKRNAQRLQEAFRNKIPDLRRRNKEAAAAELKRFSESDARRGLEPTTGPKGPGEADYIPWGSTIYYDETIESKYAKYTNEQLCRPSDTSAREIEKVVQASACTDIGAAVIAHENVHINFCRSIGFRSYDAMHAADRAQEEAEAYGAQIAVLDAAIERLSAKCAKRCPDTLPFTCTNQKTGTPGKCCDDPNQCTYDGDCCDKRTTCKNGPIKPCPPPSECCCCCP